MLGYSAVPSLSTAMHPFMVPLRPTQAILSAGICMSSSLIPSTMEAITLSGDCSDQLGRGKSVAYSLRTADSAVPSFLNSVHLLAVVPASRVSIKSFSMPYLICPDPFDS